MGIECVVSIGAVCRFEGCICVGGVWSVEPRLCMILVCFHAATVQGCVE